MMKRILFCLAVFAVPVLFHSCGSEDSAEFDETLLYGKWKSGTLYYKYVLDDHTGSTWDTADDVQEDEAQKFTWQLRGSTLTQNHTQEMGGAVPKSYTITQLTSSTLRYKDDYKSYTFTKTN
jgi:hypothetical protein